MSGELLLLQYSRQFQDICNTNYSLFLHPNHHTKCLPYVEEWKLIDLVNGTVTTSLFGSTATFEIPTDGNIVGCIYLKIVVPALTANGASNVCLVDYAGWAMIRSVDTYIGSTKVNSISAEELFAWYSRMCDPNQWKAVQSLVGGNLSQQSRINAASGTQTFYVPILQPFSRETLQMKYPELYYPIKDVFRQNQLRIYINFQPMTYFIQGTGGSPTCGINVLQLLAAYYHLSGEQQLALIDLTKTSYRTKMIDTTQKVTQQLLQAGSTSYQINISNIRSPVSQIYFILRNASDVTTNYANNPFDNLQLCADFSVVASGISVQRSSTLDQLSELQIVNRKYIGNPNLRIFQMIFEVYPLNEATDFSGSIDFSALNNPMLTVYFSSAPTVNIQLDLYSCVPNYVTISNQAVFKDYN